MAVAEDKGESSRNPAGLTKDLAATGNSHQDQEEGSVTSVAYLDTSSSNARNITTLSLQRREKLLTRGQGAASITSSAAMTLRRPRR